VNNPVNKANNFATASIVHELRERERWCSKRYSKLAGQYIKLKAALAKVDPVAAKQFKDPCQIW